jgi:hypothetical protein
MRRLLPLLLVLGLASSLASCATTRPPNDEVTIRLTSPPKEPASSRPAPREPPEACPATRPSR